jgi:hypothetical protein
MRAGAQASAADTVIIKYNVLTGGFTRQVFLNKSFHFSGVVVKRSAVNPDTILFVNSPAVPDANTIYRYRFRATPGVASCCTNVDRRGRVLAVRPDGLRRLPRSVPDALVGERRALPIVVTLTPFVDQQQLENVVLSIQAAAPGAPADGDLWLDTSAPTPTSGTRQRARSFQQLADYVCSSAGSRLGEMGDRPGGGGEKGTRATIPIAFKPCAVRASSSPQRSLDAGRVSIEVLGQAPHW